MDYTNDQKASDDLEPGVTNVTVPLRGDLSNSLARAATDGKTDNEPAACDKRHRTGKQQQD